MWGTIPDDHWADIRRANSPQARSHRPAAAQPRAMGPESQHHWYGYRPSAGTVYPSRWLASSTWIARRRSSPSEPRAVWAGVALGLTRGDETSRPTGATTALEGTPMDATSRGPSAA